MHVKSLKLDEDIYQDTIPNQRYKEKIMIVTKKYIKNLREKSFLNISADMERKILEKFGKEPEPDEEGNLYEYSEQDIWEQIRKMIRTQ